VHAPFYAVLEKYYITEAGDIACDRVLVYPRVRTPAPQKQKQYIIAMRSFFLKVYQSTPGLYSFVHALSTCVNIYKATSLFFLALLRPLP
jgi:predicted O-methyltransferase YrrM